MGHIKNVEEIIKISESHETPNLLASKYIRKNVDNLIRSRAINHKEITFEIPAMIVSNPHYDRKKVAKRICSHYTKLGFTCKLDGFCVNISWSTEEEDPEEESDEELEDESEDETTSYQGDDEVTETKKVILKNPSLQIRLKDFKDNK